jgi:hypothetical protein
LPTLQGHRRIVLYDSMHMKYRLGPVSKSVAEPFPKVRLEESAEQVPRRLCFAASSALLLSWLLFPAVQAEAMQPACSAGSSPSTLSTIIRGGFPNSDRAIGCFHPADSSAVEEGSPAIAAQLIVIGFMGGRVKGDNLIHKEALLAKELQQDHPLGVYAAVFANHNAQDALKVVLHLLDRNHDGRLSADEKNSARIVIYGHSWGASETVAFARQLNTLGIPVLLTIQVDSVQKLNEDDTYIPPNVREAINFYQIEGLLHGRPQIEAMDPKRTTILGNFVSSYKSNPVSCTNYPWIARVFMKSHIEIENDPSVWGKIASLIQAKLN